MNDTAHQEVLKESALLEASAWQLRLAENASLEISTEFQHWLAVPENRAAFRATNLAWRSASDFALEPRMLDMRQAALGRARDAGKSRWAHSRLLHRLVAAAVILAVIGSASVYYVNTRPNIYLTSVGERRTFMLSDGSKVALDSDSQVQVQYSATGRTLTLDKGRARFDVAHDSSRPFSVTAGSETVVAVGTAFDVEKIDGKVVITLIHGRIVVKNANAAREEPRRRVVKPVSMQSGQQMVASEVAPTVIKPANIEDATAWESGRLLFSGDTLAEAVVRVNRYADHPIEVDPAISSIRIIGSFNAGDVTTFVSAVTSYFPVQATTTADNTIRLEPKR